MGLRGGFGFVSHFWSSFWALALTRNLLEDNGQESVGDRPAIPLTSRNLISVCLLRICLPRLPSFQCLSP